MNVVNSEARQMTEILTLSLGGEAFAVEAGIVSEILDMVPLTQVPNAPAYAPALINVRGRVVPLVDFRVRLGMENHQTSIDTRIVVVEVLIDGEPTIIGILADKVYEVTEIDLAGIDQTPRVGMRWRSEFIRGIGRRGADFLIILDIERIIACEAGMAEGETHKGNSERQRALQGVS